MFTSLEGTDAVTDYALKKFETALSNVDGV